MRTIHSLSALQNGRYRQCKDKYVKFCLHWRRDFVQRSCSQYYQEVRGARRRHLEQVRRGSQRENRTRKGQRENVPWRDGGVQQKSRAQNILQAGGGIDDGEVGPLNLVWEVGVVR